MIISPSKAMEAAVVLGVDLDGVTLESMTQAYWRRAKECHPDHHGNDKLDEWARISWAKECLTHWLAKHPPVTPPMAEGQKCVTCDGSGRVKLKTKRFGAPLTAECAYCRGAGIIEMQEDDHD